jgi:branched-chain amino acid transport system permease protein
MSRAWVPFALCLILALIVVLCSVFGGDQLQIALIEMLIRVTVVVGLSMFVGNTGVLSFGHIGFMCIGAYGAAWASCDPGWKGMMLTGLPLFLQDHQYPFAVAVFGGALLSAIVALLLGAAIMRLSGIAASIATFAFLLVVNSIYGNWDSVTAGSSSVVGIPAVVGPWTAYVFAAFSIAVAWLFRQSGVGLMLRASRDDEIAAKSCGVRVVRSRFAAFVFSAFIVGLAGGLYAHFLGIITVNMFYLDLTFVTIAMLVIGGASSLSGAVSGVVLITVVTEVLRGGEAGIRLGSTTFTLPRGAQEIGLGVVMILVLIFRPAGLSGGQEIPSPFREL